MDTGSVSIRVMSKTFGLAGLRIGWIATHNKEFVRRFLSLKDYTTICSSAPSEFLATVALQHKKPIIGRNLQIIRTNIGHLNEFFSTFPDVMTWTTPVANSTGFARVVSGQTAEEFCDEIREKTGVLLLPGSVFGVSGPYVRIGYGREDMKVSLDRLMQYLNS